MRARPATQLLFVVLGLAAGASSSTCTTSLDAIGTGGGAAVGSVVVTTGASTVGVSVSTGVAVTPEAPCGLHYDWDSCEVGDLTPVTATADQASAALIGVWRRCNEDGGGTFPVAVKLLADGTIYRMYRKPNPYGSGTPNVVHCGSDEADQGSWAVIANDGGGGGGSVGGDHRLEIEWDDGTSESLGLVLYPGLQAFGLLHGLVDSDDTSERFKPEGDVLPGSEP